MISAMGLSVCRRLTAHRQGEKRGARTSTVPNPDNSRRARLEVGAMLLPLYTHVSRLFGPVSP